MRALRAHACANSPYRPHVVEGALELTPAHAASDSVVSRCSMKGGFGLALTEAYGETSTTRRDVRQYQR